MAIGSVADRGLTFEAHSEGEASLVAREADAVVDFISVRVRPVSRVTLSRPTGRATDAEGCDITDWSPGEGGYAEVAEGERIDVQAIPYDGPTRLAGDLHYDWESLTPELLRVIPSGNRLAHIDGLAAGTGRVAVRVGAHEEIIEVPILASMAGSTGAEDPTTGEDTGEGTGTSTGEDASDASGGESTGGSR